MTTSISSDLAMSGDVSNLDAEDELAPLPPRSVDVQLGEVTLEPALPAAQLQRGDHGNSVEQLQEALVAYGVMRQDDAEGSHGIFNGRTEDAVKKLQAELGVKADGVVGVQTLWAYDSLHLDAGQRDVAEAAKGLKRGDRGPAVEKLQAALVAAGFMTKEEVATGPGVFGPRTQRALEKFEKANAQPTEKAPPADDQLFNEAQLRLSLGRDDEARELLEKLLTKDGRFRLPESASPKLTELFEQARVRIREEET